MKNLNHEFLRYLTCDLEMDPVEVASSSANELFDSVLAYEGHGMFGGIAVRNWVKLVYGVDLEEIGEKIARRECGEM